MRKRIAIACAAIPALAYALVWDEVTWTVHDSNNVYADNVEPIVAASGLVYWQIVSATAAGYDPYAGAVWHVPISSDVDPWPDSISTNDLDRAAAAANPTYVAATNGISGHGSFDGGDYAVVSNTAFSSSWGGGFAVVLWAKRLGAANYQDQEWIQQAGRFFFGEDASAARVPQLRITDDDSSGHYVYVNHSDWTFGDHTDVWHWWVGVYPGGASTSLKLYCDGVDVGAAPVSVAFDQGMETTTAPMYICDPGDAFDTIDIDAIAVFTNAADITQAWVTSNYYETAYGGGTNGYGMSQYIYDNPDSIRDGLRCALTWREDQDLVQDWSGNGNHGDRSASGTTHQGDYINIAAAGSVVVTSVGTTNSVVFWAGGGGTWTNYAKVGATEYVNGSVQAFTEANFYSWSGTDLTIGTGTEFDCGNFYVFTNVLSQGQVQTISGQAYTY